MIKLRFVASIAILSFGVAVVNAQSQGGNKNGSGQSNASPPYSVVPGPAAVVPFAMSLVAAFRRRKKA